MRYVLLMQKCLLAVVICFQLGTASAFAAILSVPQKKQEKTEWCWAATSQAILEYYGVEKTQTEIAEYGTGGENIQNFLWSTADNPQKGVYEILKNFGSIWSSGSRSPLDRTMVQNEMDAGRPIVINWKWDTGGGHILVGYGMEDGQMYLMDPLQEQGSDPIIATYDWVVSGDGHTWEESLKMTTDPPETVARDCNGDWGGTAFADDCGECVGGNTGKTENTSCVQDCNCDWGGTAVTDNCGNCVGGNTDQTACVQDCNGDWGGTAFADDCGECVGGNTEKTPCVLDCNGDRDGTAFLDNCGNCVGGNTGKLLCIDISNDRFIDLHDLISGLKILSGTDTSDTEIYSGADVNDDARIGMEEIVRLLQAIADTIPSDATDPL